MFDAHCHIDLPIFEGEVDAVLSRAKRSGVTGVIVAGVDPPGWLRQRAIAAAFSEVHITYGLHPWAVSKLSEQGLHSALNDLEEALSGPGNVTPVGLGELGLDRSRQVSKESLPLQVEAYRRQLAIARDRDLPVVLHVVKAHGLAFEIAAADKLPKAGGMVHGFSGSPEMAARWLALGLHISFSTALARPQYERLRQACKSVPRERLLVETDAPDQSAQPKNEGPNEPANLHEAVSALAKARGEPAETIATITERNARRLFRLPPHDENSCFAA